MTTQTPQDPVTEVWQLFRETAERFKETDAKFKETDAKFKETAERFKETDAKFKETDARLDQRSRETDEKLRRLEGLFGDQWGKLMEALVQLGVLQLFQQRGIQVRRLHQRSKAQLNGSNLEVDLILEDGSEVVVVEVKSTLRVADIDEFLDEELAQFTTFFPVYRGYTIYGAVAGLTFAEEADRYAYRKGLFVVQVMGESSARILNDNNFRPTNFETQRPSKRRRG